MINNELLRFDPQQQGGYFIPTGQTWVRTSEELRSAIREESYRDALDFISSMDKDAVGEPDSHGQTALHWAALCDNEELCKALLEKMDPKAIYLQTNESRQTALHFAVREGSKKFIKQLMESKFAKQLAETEDKDGQTPLHWAVSRGNLEICLELYRNMSPEKIALVSRERGQTVLHCAVSARNLELVQLLISDEEKGKELVGLQDKYGQTALHWAAGLGDLKICQVLYFLSESVGVLYVQTIDHKYSVLHLAVHAKQTEIVRLFTEQFEKGEGLVGVVDQYGQTALHWAVSMNCYEICEILYDKMTPEQIWTAMERKQTVLHFAVQGKNQKIVELLLKHNDVAKGLVGRQDKFGQTALHWAAGLGDLKICQVLYFLSESVGVLYVQTIDHKYSVLHLAVHAKQTEIVRLFTEQFKKGEGLVGVVDRYGQTALHWAASLNCYEICEILYDKMTPEQIWTAMNPEERKQTVLHFAVQGKNQKIVELLLKHNDVAKGLVGRQDKFGQTALQIAEQANDLKMVALLTKRSDVEE